MSFLTASGVGTDLLRVDRIRKALDRHGERFAKRVLCPEELAIYRSHRDPAGYLAKAFAAKEALSKSLGTGIAGGVSFQDFLIRREPSGKPVVKVSGEAERLLREKGEQACLLLSLSDDGDWIQAFSVLSLVAAEP